MIHTRAHNEIRRKGWSYRDSLDEKVAAGMIAQGYSPNDLPAISLITSIVQDEFERAEIVSRAESDRLSQAVTINNVQRIMKDMIKRNFPQTLNQQFNEWPTERTVRFSEIEIIDDSHCRFRERIYATKENLRYKPSMVRLVSIQQ
jgi:hypothetical protein